MPVPIPHPGEDQTTFVARAHRALAKEFPNTKQRNGLIFDTWRRHRGESEEEKVAHALFDQNKYEYLQDIPVFKEHSYQRMLRDPKTGQPVLDEATGQPRTVTENYDLKALATIVKNCNERVLKNESFAPITGIHTGRKKADGTTEDPEVLGFGGPFRLGMWGEEERTDGEPMKGKWAIYEDEFWFKDKAHRAREKSRRSPEVYVGRPMHQRFLDPITALGAETPALDMGTIHYWMNKKGHLIEQYAGPEIEVYGAPVMPAATNVAVPQPVKTAKKPKLKVKLSEEEAATPGQQDDKVQYDDDELKALSSKVKAFHAGEVVKHTKMAQDFHAKGDLGRAKKHERFAAWHTREMQPYIKDEGEGSLEVPAKPAGGDELRKHFTQAAEAFLIAQYGQADPETVQACVQAMMETQPLKWVINQMQSAAAPVVGSMEQQVAEGQGKMGPAAQEEEEETEALAEEEEPEAEEEEEEEVEAEGGPPPADNEEQEEEDASSTPKGETEMADAPVVDPKKKEEKENYQLLRDQNLELTAKYQQLSATIAKQGETITSLQHRLAEADTKSVMADRRTRIVKLRVMGFPIDEADEIERCSLENMPTEKAFAMHLETIVKYGQPNAAPIGLTLPTPGLEEPEYIADPQRRTAEVAQYGGQDQATVEEIAQYQLRKQTEGEYLSWADAKEKVLEKKQKKAKKAAKTA